MSIPLITTLLVFVSVTLAVMYGWPYVWAILDKRSDSDAQKYAGWIDELFLDWTPSQAKQAAIVSNVAILVATLVTYALAGVVFAFAAGFVTFWVPKLLYNRARNKRAKRFEEQLPDAIEVMVASVRAGRSLAQAIEDVASKLPAPIGQEFGVMASEYRDGGLSVDETLRRSRRRVNLESYTMITSALIINTERGGDVLLMLERMGASIREMSRLKKKIMTEMSEVRAQEKIILILTPIFGTLVCFMDEAIPHILFYTIPGNLLLVLVAGLQAGSIMWIRRIAKTAI
jgi:tight adherence protein B